LRKLEREMEALEGGFVNFENEDLEREQERKRTFDK